jgi:hypothetical protein
VSGPRYDRTLILASITFALLIAATLDTLAQDATFNERYPTKQTPAQGAPEQVSRPAPETTPRIAEAKREHVAKSGRVASTKPPATQVVVEPRSFLDAGTGGAAGAAQVPRLCPPADAYPHGRGAKYRRARGLAPFTTARAVLSLVTERA